MIRIVGECRLERHPYRRGISLVIEDFEVKKGGWTLKVKSGARTDGASIPFPFSLFLDKYDKDYITAAVAHDCLVGQFSDFPQTVVDSVGNARTLTWKESAIWMREIMKADPDNNERIRRIFYQAVMLKKRLRLRK